MSDEQNMQIGPITEADLSAQLMQMSAQEIVQSAADALPAAPTVTHESLLTELVGAVKKCARGVSHEIEDILSRAEKHFGL